MASRAEPRPPKLHAVASTEWPGGLQGGAGSGGAPLCFMQTIAQSLPSFLPGGSGGGGAPAPKLHAVASTEWRGLHFGLPTKSREDPAIATYY